MRTLILSVIVLATIATSSVAQTHRDWSYNLGMYEVNVRQYSSAGTFKAFGEHLERLDSMGVGILWFMPIHPIGQQNRIGTLGSYYSVRDYKGINPEFGTMDDFKALVDSAHARGMYVIIDWVANHTSWDNNLTQTHPEWYAKDGSGNFIPPPGTNWTDVIELDYNQQGLRDYMVEALKFWVDSADVDGFRFDAASYVPNDFWSEAFTQLKEHKSDIFLLAEADGKSFHDSGFDMTHAWSFYGFGYGKTIDVVNGTGNAATMYSYFSDEKITYNNGRYRLYFTSNHDENSWQGTTTELFGNAAEVFAVIAATANGMPLIYSGQEAGLNKRLQFFEKDPISWREHPNYDLYKTLLDLKRRNSALWNGLNANGLSRIFPTDYNSVLSYQRVNGSDKVFVIANLTDSEKTVSFQSTAYLGAYRNVFTGQDTVFVGGETATLPAWSYQIYEASENLVSTELDDEPLTFQLHQNFPNPFNPSTIISYELTQAGNVRVSVYDILGREVAVLVNGQQGAGYHQVTFDATGLSSGTYVYRLETPPGVVSRKMMLMK